MIPMAQCYIFAAIFRERTAINERERSICAPAADVCRQRRGDGRRLECERMHRPHLDAGCLQMLQQRALLASGHGQRPEKAGL